MNLTSILQKSSSKEDIKEIADWAVSKPENIKTLVQMFISGTKRLVQKSSAPLELCIKKNPQLAILYLDEFITLLEQDKISVTHKRNILRLLQHIAIPEQYQGKLPERCFAYLLSSQEPVAVKVFSMTILYNLVREHPDLKEELKIVLEDQFPYASPGFRSRAGKILKKI